MGTTEKDLNFKSYKMAGRIYKFLRMSHIFSRQGRNKEKMSSRLMGCSSFLNYMLYPQRSFAAWLRPNSINFPLAGLPVSQSQLLTS